MKIVHLDSHLPWRGGEQQVLYLSQFLCANGHESVIVCPPQSILYQRATQAGLPLRPLRVRHELDLLAAWRLGCYLRQQQTDILHMHTPHAHTIGLLASWLAPEARKVVSRRVDFAPIRNMFSRYKYNAAGVHYVAVSETVRRVLLAGGIPVQAVQTVHSGVDLNRIDTTPEIAPLFPPGRRVIGTVGHLAGHKGHTYLLQAIQHVQQHEPLLQVVIIGEGALRRSLEAEARALGVAERVHFMGFCDHPLPLIRQWEMFVFPSVMEGLGTSVLDAMALGTPVIATRAGGIPEIVQDGVTGLLVPPRDPLALAHAVHQLLRDPAQGRAFGAAGRQRVEKYFTAARMGEHTLAIYQQLLATTQVEAPYDG